MVLFPSIFGHNGLFASLFLAPDKLLIGLGFLLPLILLYLIRPKPVNVAVPSLMFILKDMGKSNVNRLFRTLLKDILFLIQLLCILLLALALAKPFINVNQESLVQQSIIILDTSASTRAFSDARFKDVKDAAIDSLSKDNIVILAHMNPQILDRSGDIRLSAGQAKDIINSLDPTDMPGDIPTALTLAEEHVSPDSKVTIVSDFVLSHLENPDLIEAKLKVLRSKGALVEVKEIEASGDNVGIIDAQLNNENATLDVKIQNFNDAPEEIGLEYNGDRIELPKKILEPRGNTGSLLSISIPIARGKSEIVLTPKDDFEVDNHYYVSIPDQARINVLVITNDDRIENSRVVPALKASGDQFTTVNVEYGKPPKVPTLEHDIYIMKDINTQFILPGVINGLHEKVEEGAVLVVFAQEGLFTIDMLDLLPVRSKPGNPLGGRVDLIVNTSLSFMRGLSDVGQVDGNQLLRAQPTENAISYISVSTNDGLEPVLAAKRIGKGAIIYYGIKDRPSFDIDPQSYAVLWGRIVDYSLLDPMSLNVPTGAVITSAQGSIKTPLGRSASPALVIQGGFYQAGPLTLAANLYPLHVSRNTIETSGDVRYESLIGEGVSIKAGDTADAESGEIEETKIPKDLSTHFILLGLFVLLFELFYIKYRGDL